MTASPGLHAVIMATIIASVLPHVTTRCLSGSSPSPMKRDCFAASASRKFGAPQVTAYWCGPVPADSASAATRAGGGSKSGKPWDRLMASCLLATLVMRRMTDSVKMAVRWLVCGMLSYVPLYKAITRRRSAVSIQQSANSFQHSALEKTQERESTPKTSGVASPPIGSIFARS